MKVKPDGTFDFGDKGLLSLRAITNEALRMLMDGREKQESIEQSMKIRALRASCGAENLPIRVKMWSKDDGEADNQSA